MARLKVKLTEMKNADVRWISLVKRGANRIPFRVIKSLKESEMSLDLSSIRRMKTEQPKPTVVGIVVHASEDGQIAALTDALKAEGYEVAKVHKYEDGTAMFSQGELPEEGEGTLVRLSDNMVVVVKNGDAQAEIMADASALHADLQAEGFFFGPEVVTKAMQEVIGTVLKSDGDKSVAIQKATKQFQDYMDALSALVPENVMKMDDAIGAALKKFDDEKAAKAEADKAEADKAAEEAAAKEKDKEAEGSAAEENAESKAQEDAEKAKGQDEAKKSDNTAELLAAITGLTEAVNAVKSEVAGIKESQSKLEGQITEVAEKAEKANTAVKTTVVASASKGDEPQGGKARKSDEDPRSGFYDTAFLPKRK